MMLPLRVKKPKDSGQLRYECPLHPGSWIMKCGRCLQPLCAKCTGLVCSLCQAKLDRGRRR